MKTFWQFLVFLWKFYLAHRHETEAVIWRCSVKKGVLRNFKKFTGKHLCQSLRWLLLVKVNVTLPTADLGVLHEKLSIKGNSENTLETGTFT